MNPVVHFGISMLLAMFKRKPRKPWLAEILAGFNAQIEALFALADENDGVVARNNEEIEGLRSENAALMKEGHSASTVALKLQGLISA